MATWHYSKYICESNKSQLSFRVEYPPFLHFCRSQYWGFRIPQVSLKQKKCCVVVSYVWKGSCSPQEPVAWSFTCSYPAWVASLQSLGLHSKWTAIFDWMPRYAHETNRCDRCDRCASTSTQRRCPPRWSFWQHSSTTAFNKDRTQHWAWPKKWMEPSKEASCWKKSCASNLTMPCHCRFVQMCRASWHEKKTDGKCRRLIGWEIWPGNTITALTAKMRQLCSMVIWEDTLVCKRPVSKIQHITMQHVETIRLSHLHSATLKPSHLVPPS